MSVHSSAESILAPFETRPRIRVVFGDGALDRIGGLARELEFRRTLLVSDPGVVAAGHVGQAHRLLTDAGIEVCVFDELGTNPDTAMLETGRDVAVAYGIDSIIGLGGGSSLDGAKGINFLLTQGGRGIL